MQITVKDATEAFEEAYSWRSALVREALGRASSEAGKTCA